MSTAVTQLPDVVQEFANRGGRLSTEEYNYEHFRPWHLLADAQRTLANAGIRSGATAPDFELPRVGGGSLRLSDLRGKPTLLKFGSFT